MLAPQKTTMTTSASMPLRPCVPGKEEERLLLPGAGAFGLPALGAATLGAEEKDPLKGNAALCAFMTESCFYIQYE